MDPSVAVSFVVVAPQLRALVLVSLGILCVCGEVGWTHSDDVGLEGGREGLDGVWWVWGDGKGALTESESWYPHAPYPTEKNVLYTRAKSEISDQVGL